MRDRIQQFLEETFLFSFQVDVSEDDDLFKTGIIDSFGYIRLIAFIQDEFGISYSDEDVLTNVMVSFKQIVSSVEQKVQQELTF